MQLMYIKFMKFEWNPEKNEWLKKERNISFEQIIFHLSQGDIWKTSDHPGQKIYFVIVDNFIYLVPHIIEKKIFF